MIYKRFEDIKVGDVYLFTGRDYWLEGLKVRIVERGEFAADDELTVYPVDGVDNDGPADNGKYYVKQGDLTELEQQDDQWEWGIAHGTDELVDPHRTGMTEDAAREWVRSFEDRDGVGGRVGAFIVIKRPVGKWEVA